MDNLAAAPALGPGDLLLYPGFETDDLAYYFPRNIMTCLRDVFLCLTFFWGIFLVRIRGIVH